MGQWLIVLPEWIMGKWFNLNDGFVPPEQVLPSRHMLRDGCALVFMHFFIMHFFITLSFMSVVIIVIMNRATHYHYHAMSDGWSKCCFCHPF
jgi:hypothetical protein